MKAHQVVVGLLGTQIVLLSLGLGQPWTHPPSPVCAVSAQYPMLMALFVHLVALVCTAVQGGSSSSGGGSSRGGPALILVILAIIGLAIPLPIGLYFYLYACDWTNVVWCAETLLNGVLIAYWWWTPSTTAVVTDSPSVSETDEFTRTV